MKENTAKSTNLKKGNFKKEELHLYGLENNEIDIILQYQKLLPILQEENNNWINARILYEQLEVKRQFSDWIKDKIKKYDFIKDVDFTSFHKNVKAENTFINTIEYIINIDMAKELSMVQNNKIGKIARKYFIYIERALKNRIEWNIDRDETMFKCKALKRALIRHDKQILPSIPKYFNNKFIAEFCLLNEVIIGMTASEYRKRKGYGKDYPIRNSFTEKELEYVHILEQYDADLIEVQNEYKYDKRKEFLSKKFELLIG